MGYILKFTNTVSPPPPPKCHILEGTAKKSFDANAPTSSLQISDQVSANVINILYACCPSGCVTACVVYTADSIRRFVSKTNRMADSIRDSIRTKKYDSQGPTFY